MSITYEFYLDVFWVTNLILDGAVLTLTALLGKERISLVRIPLSAAFGATASACLFLGLSSYGGYQFILHFFVNPAMLLIAFSWKTVRSFLVRFLESYVISALLGGLMSWLWPMGAGEGFWLWAAAGIFLVTLILMGLRLRQGRQQLYEILLVIDGQRLSCKGFLDTGNLLWDPLLHRPVHIIQKELLPTEIQQGQGIHYIPYQSLGNENGILSVAVLEGMYIRKHAGGTQYIEKPVCGLAEKAIFSGKPYQMILHGTTME